MLKRVIVLLLFVQFSFGQENESSLELAKEGKISIGAYWENSLSNHRYRYQYDYTFNFNYHIKKSMIGVSYSIDNVESDRKQPHYPLIGIRYGYNISNNSKALFTAKSGKYFTSIGLGLTINEKNRIRPELHYLHSFKKGYDNPFNRIGFGFTYALTPSKKRAIKKLTQAKNALDMELITQEEYDKIYVKYAHFAKDKP